MVKQRSFETEEWIRLRSHISQYLRPDGSKPRNVTDAQIADSANTVLHFPGRRITRSDVLSARYQARSILQRRRRGN